MEENPQQLYTSGLIFAPSDSLVRQKFANEALQSVQNLPKTHPHWPYCVLRSLEAHGGDVHILALSERGRILASASSDLTIRLWDVITGKTTQSYPRISRSNNSY
jgi:FOG: WD40 repeat